MFLGVFIDISCRYCVAKTKESDQTYLFALDRKDELEKNVFQTELEVVRILEGMQCATVCVH